MCIRGLAGEWKGDMERKGRKKPQRTQVGEKEISQPSMARLRHLTEQEHRTSSKDGDVKETSGSICFPGKNTGVGLPCPSPGDLPDPGIKSMSPALQEDSLLLSHWGNPNNIVIILTLYLQELRHGE